jgi:hypothetical protein
VNTQIAIALLACLVPVHATAQKTSFTPEQEAEIGRRIDVMREDVRAQLMVEMKQALEAELSKSSAVQFGAKSKAQVQSQTPASPEDSRGRSEAARLLSVSPTISDAPVFRGFESLEQDEGKVEFDVVFDEKKAVAAFQWIDAGQIDFFGRDDRVAVLGTSTVKLSAPINDKESGFASFADLDSLASGLNLKLGYSWRVRNVRFLDGLHEDAGFNELCRLSGQDRNVGCDSDIIYAAAERDAALMEKLLDFEAKRLGWVKHYEVEVQAAKADFEYISSTLVADTVSKSGWGVTLKSGFQSPRGNFLFQVGGDYARQYRAGKSGIICPALSAAPVVCVQGALSPPRQQDSRRLWVGLRGDVLGFAYDARITHDFVTDENAIDLPIYLVRNKAGTFSAGLRFGWTEQDDVTAAIFISKPFSMQ